MIHVPCTILDKIEDDMSKAWAESLKETINFEVLAKMLVQAGWHHVYIPRVLSSELEPMAQWAETNCIGQHRGLGGTWVFEAEIDAAMFKLRWMR